MKMGQLTTAQEKNHCKKTIPMRKQDMSCKIIRNYFMRLITELLKSISYHKIMKIKIV